MKISLLHESLSTGAVAMRPAALGGQISPIGKKRGKDKTDSRWYLKFSRTTDEQIQEDGKKGLPSGKPRQPSTNVWQWYKSKKQKRWWDSYAAKNNPDERLLQNFRGKGY